MRLNEDTMRLSDDTMRLSEYQIRILVRILVKTDSMSQ